MKDLSRTVQKQFQSTVNPIPVEQAEKGDNLFSMLVIAGIIDFIVIVINIFALMWIHHLEEIACKCSENWKRDYIKYFLYVFFAMVIFRMIAILFTGRSLLQQNMLLSSIMFLYYAFSLVNMFIAIIYINELKNINCECSEDIRREVYFYYNIVRLALFGIMLLLLLGGLLMIGNLIRPYTK
ncbi:hypothetical protein [Flavobacterium sp.]|jgi:hypothetical protein|uniref:hypothetical protein n=1 Tax=Flavobacterium sp. TaxID=239 RepID=UPI0037BFD40A